MSLSDIWKTVSSNPSLVTIIVILLMSFIEISKIKINPWSAIGRLFGKFLGITAVSNKVDALEKKVDENQATTIRVRILRFEDEVQNDQIHSKDSWDQCMDDIRRYELYTDSHPEFRNNITVASIRHLTKLYDELLEEHAWSVKSDDNGTEK